MAGFSIAGAFNKSLFSKDSYKAAIGSNNSFDSDENGYAVVKISPKFARLGQTEKDPDIIGVFNTSEGDYSFTIDSSWADMGGIASSVLNGAGGSIAEKYEKTGSIASLGGATLQGNAYASKKIYQKSNYMEIKIPMMVVDWNGTGQPLMSAMLLALYCLPSNNLGEDISRKISSYIDDQIEQMQNSENKIVQAVAYTSKAVKNYTEGAIISAKQRLNELSDAVGGDYAKDNILGDLDDVITLRSSPTPIMIKIGNFFSHNDMVIERLEYTFSKEMTKAGPLYAKFNLSLSTRKILTNLEDIGLAIPKNNRYLQVGGNLV